MEIETARLHLREFVLEDADALYAIESDDNVLYYVTYGPFSREQVDEEIRSLITQQFEAQRIVYHLAVTDKTDGHFIGWCGVKITNARHREGELGYAFARDAWGKGYATEAANVMLRVSFQELNLHRIFATTHPENTASRHVLEKLNMAYEGTLRGHKWHRTAWRDSALYAILAEDWQEPGLE